MYLLNNDEADNVETICKSIHNEFVDKKINPKIAVMAISELLLKYFVMFDAHPMEVKDFADLIYEAYKHYVKTKKEDQNDPT